MWSEAGPVQFPTMKTKKNYRATSQAYLSSNGLEVTHYTDYLGVVRLKLVKKGSKK